MKRQVYNPYLPAWEYIPDGEPRVFGDRLYIFGNHDRFGAEGYCENDYVAWSAPVEDLSDWRYEGVIYRKDQTPWNTGNSKHSVWPNPLQDYEQAMEMIRMKAEEWKIFSDKIAVIGFSAGGHLAAAAATMSENRPNAAILGYPVTGSDVQGCCATAPDTISCVDKNTCPCFVFATRTDEIVPVMNSIRFMEALVQADISFESHIYSYGPHGFSTCDTSVQSLNTAISPRVPNWVSDSIGWLKEIFGDFGNGEMTKPVCKAHVTDNGGEFLSVDCTFGYVMGNPEGRKVVEGFLGGAGKQEGPRGQQDSQMTSGMMSMASGMKLRQLLEYAHMPEEVIDQVNDQLSMIPNKG